MTDEDIDESEARFDRAVFLFWNDPIVQTLAALLVIALIGLAVCLIPLDGITEQTPDEVSRTVPERPRDH